MNINLMVNLKFFYPVEPRGFVKLHIKGAKELKNTGKLGGKIFII